MSDEPALLSIKEAAEYLRVSTKTIRRWIKANELPAYRVGAKNIVLRVNDLDRMLQPINEPTQSFGVIYV